MEFVTCDAGFAYQYCVYSDSPRPNVVYGYDPNRGTYVPDTPRFARYLQGDIETDVQAAEAEMGKPEEDRDSATCVVLRPVLETIYRTGKFDGGLELLRRLYGNESDYPEVQKSIVETIKASQHFASR